MDDDDDERENFEITDWDLQNEFNPHRQRHWQTKEEATYGVWAERDSDEERPSFGGKRYCLARASSPCLQKWGGWSGRSAPLSVLLPWPSGVPWLCHPGGAGSSQAGMSS